VAYSQEVVSAVRGSYIYESLTLSASASKHDVYEKTAALWKRKAKVNGDDWDKARSAARLASGGLGEITSRLLEDFALLFKSTIDDISTGDHDGLEKAEAISRLSDAYAKTMKAAATGSPKIAKLSIALEVIQELSNIIKTDFPEILIDFLPILDKLETRINKLF